MARVMSALGRSDKREMRRRSVADFVAASTLAFPDVPLSLGTHRKETVRGPDCNVDRRVKIRDTTGWLE